MLPDQDILGTSQSCLSQSTCLSSQVAVHSLSSSSGTLSVIPLRYESHCLPRNISLVRAKVSSDALRNLYHVPYRFYMLVTLVQDGGPGP